MKILLLNQDWFASEWIQAGHEVVSCGLDPHLDVVIPRGLVHIDTVIKLLPNGFTPDVIVYHDNSMPLLFFGLEETSIPTVFYSVDTHHHVELHSRIAHIFDATFVAQKDYIEEFAASGIDAEWLPLWASRFVEGSSEREHGAVFVGTLNPALNPERVRFFDALKEKVPLLCMTGFWPEIFPKSEIVINQTVKGDLNFRVFEAMMCGPMLLTERTGNGLFDLFTEGEHLAVYSKNNVDEAAEMIRMYLDRPGRARDVGAAGRAEIMRAHLPVHRAERLLRTLERIQKRSSSRKHIAAMLNFSLVGQRFMKKELEGAAAAFVGATKALHASLRAGESLTDTEGFYAVAACFWFDHYMHSDLGRALLNEVAEANPDIAVIQYGKVRNLLAEGLMTEATEIAVRLSDAPPNETFVHIDKTLGSLLRGDFME